MKPGDNKKRLDGRTAAQMREIRITSGINPYAEGSAEVQLGSTKLVITASVDKIEDDEQQDEIPSEGMVFAALGILPRSMHIRIRESELSDIVRQELSSLEHLVVRSLRAAVPAAAIPNLSITLDCTILCSDAGIASAAVAGCWVALYHSLRWSAVHKLVSDHLDVPRIAGVSGGIVDGCPLIDLCAEEAANADFTANIVFDEHLKLIDVRGSREREAIDLAAYHSLLELASKQVGTIFAEQQRAVLQI